MQGSVIAAQKQNQSMILQVKVTPLNVTNSYLTISLVPVQSTDLTTLPFLDKLIFLKQFSVILSKCNKNQESNIYQLINYHIERCLLNSHALSNTKNAGSSLAHWSFVSERK